MDLKEAKEIGKIRKIVNEENRPRTKKMELLAELEKIERSEKEESRQKAQKVEITNQREVQKVEGKTDAEVKNWPSIFKVAGEVVAKVAFPVIQKIEGRVMAKVDNWPVVQKVVGIVDANVKFPQVQQVEVTNPTQKMYVEGKQEITNLPLGKGNKEGDPEMFVAVRFTDGNRYYDLTELTIAGGGGSAVSYADPDQRWIREDFTYDANNNITRAVAYDGKGFKKTVDFEYDADSNMTRKTVRIESNG